MMDFNKLLFMIWFLKPYAGWNHSVQILHSLPSQLALQRFTTRNVGESHSDGKGGIHFVLN